MRIFQRHAVSLGLFFFVSLFAVSVYALHLTYKMKHDAEARSMQANAGRGESDLERREREEKELGHSLWPYMQFLNKQALHPPSKEEMVADAKKGMCAIDPYSKCVTDDEYNNNQRSLTSSYEGIGIIVVSGKKGARITDVRIESPAEKAGLRIDDIVTHVIVDNNKLRLADRSADEQLALLRGIEGKPMSLVLRRNGRVIVPERIVGVKRLIPTVELTQLLAPHYGYVHIRRFVYEQTASELLHAVNLLKGREALYGFVIDLRGNPGGNFFESVKMAGFFLDGGVVTTTYNRSEGKKSHVAPPGDILSGVPIVLLADRNSASVSELFVGALTDRDIPRAILIGEKTFGKGIGQTTQTGPEGGKATITSFEFFTPKGNQIHGKGFTPDPALLENFHDKKSDDVWRGAALKYLQFKHDAVTA